MPWGAGQDTELLAFYRALIALRRASPGLWRGDRETLLADDRRALLAYRCTDGTRAAVVVLNNGPDDQRFELPDPALRLALTTARGVAADREVLTLPGYAGAVLASS